jgi:MFS transporter, DHA2 family, multidrug resistance protein
MAIGATFDGAHTNQQTTINPWLVAIAVMAGTFMEVLDTTVVNVSLPHIAGNLSATPEEATWALTSYLVANAIILPMTGWLANQFGRKRLLLGSVAGFTVASFCCGFAPSLPFLIVFRIIQGITGGGLQPLSQAILMEVFPPAERGKAMAFWALGIVVAPMLGPVLGGWLTDNYSWRWIFYINVPIGLLAVLLTQMYVFDPPYISKRAGRVDYLGMGLLVIGIGALQLLLDKGQQEDWFESPFIIVLLVISVTGIVGLVMRELKADHPVVDLRVFRNRTYATGVFLMTVVGFVLYGSTVLLPLLMQTLLGYSAMDAGIATLPRGLASFVAMPLVGLMMARIEPRRLLGAGLVVAAVSLYQLSRLSLDVGYWNFFAALMLQGAALGLLFIPLTTITNDPIPKEEMGNATSIFNLMRNIGASVGIASVTTLLARNQQIHVNQLGEHITAYSPQSRAMLSATQAALMGRGSDTVTATSQAHAAIWGVIQRQAAMMSYNDAFLLLAALFLGLLPLLLIMRKPRHHGGADLMAH